MSPLQPTQLPPAHARLWRLGAPEALPQIEALLRKRRKSNAIVVVVADPRGAVMAPALLPPGKTESASGKPIVRVFVEDIDADDDGGDDEALYVATRSYMRQLDEDWICLLVIDRCNQPVLSALTVTGLVDADVAHGLEFDPRRGRRRNRSVIP